MYFYPRSPYGERLSYSFQFCSGEYISIHALLTESDSNCFTISPDSTVFLSTLSLRRATPQKSGIDAGFRIISIHALLTESDSRTVKAGTVARVFLSTLSLRRATKEITDAVIHNCISIHALLTESDDQIGKVLVDASDISIHALLTESDSGYFVGYNENVQFLSTLSLRRATR